MENTHHECWMDIICGWDYEYERGDNKQNQKMQFDFIPEGEGHTQAESDFCSSELTEKFTNVKKQVQMLDLKKVDSK